MRRETSYCTSQGGAHHSIPNNAEATGFGSALTDHGGPLGGNDAPIPKDSALTSVGAQLWFTPNWSFIAEFDGVFVSGYQLYAGFRHAALCVVNVYDLLTTHLVLVNEV